MNRVTILYKRTVLSNSLLQHSEKFFVILKSCKKNISTGLDNIPTVLLRDCADTLRAPLSYLINMSFSTGQFPTAWKKSKVVPLYRNGPKSNVEKYRPISVIPAIFKVIEKIVHSQFYGYMEQNNLLCDQQFGFRKKRSTEIAATLFDDIKQYVNDNGLASAVFIDLCKALDTIGHARLL